MLLATTRTSIIQTTATIHSPTATQEENKDETVIATVHPQASPSPSSLSSLMLCQQQWHMDIQCLLRFALSKGSR